MAFEWSGLSLEESVRGKALVFSRSAWRWCTWTLAANTKSYVLPSLCVAGRARGDSWRRRRAGAARLQNDVYCQIGLVMLIGLR